MRAIKRGVLGMRAIKRGVYRIFSICIYRNFIAFYRFYETHHKAFYAGVLKRLPTSPGVLKTPPTSQVSKKCAVTKIRKNALIRGVRVKNDATSSESRACV
jgi:hypothetical protein